MSGAIAVGDSAWAFGPEGGERVRDRLQPVWLVGGLIGAVLVAGLIGFVAFVTFAGSKDPVQTALPRSGVESDAIEPAVAPVPLEITDIQLTDAVDAATGEPAGSTRNFEMGEQVQLWLSFEAGDDTSDLTAVWFRGDRKVAKLQAPLPGAASQMVFPLPQVAVDQPGSYRVEVRSAGDVIASQSFEVTG